MTTCEQDSLFGFPENRPGLGSVSPIEVAVAHDFVSKRHYLHRPGATSYAFGLWSNVRLIGVCTYGTIISKNAAAICGRSWGDHVLELTRLVLLDEAPKNSESYFIGQTFRLLPRPSLLISYADSAAGHIGTIYKATNWVYTGVSTKGGYVTEDGRKVHARSVSDSRKGTNAATSNITLRWEPCAPKHRYVNFIGTRSHKRAMMRDLRWPALPYPRMTEAA